jgi:Family of unknown function (DUF5985)
VAEWVYALCAITSVVCAVLLLRGYHRSRMRLLFWAGLCFVGFALNNILLFIDLIIFPTQIDLSAWRTWPAVIGVLLLLYGLIWEAD